MDIENSPDAPVHPAEPGARDKCAYAGSTGACGNGVMVWKRFCCIRHPAPRRGGRGRRLLGERAESVLWHHYSVNLVDRRW